MQKEIKSESGGWTLRFHFTRTSPLIDDKPWLAIAGGAGKRQNTPAPLSALQFFFPFSTIIQGTQKIVCGAFAALEKPDTHFSAITIYIIENGIIKAQEGATKTSYIDPQSKLLHTQTKNQKKLKKTSVRSSA